MFAALHGTIDHERASRPREWHAPSEQEARIAQRKLQLARAFEDERDWEAAGWGAAPRTPSCALQGHHLIAWERDGETVLDNLILLCHRHHTRHHEFHIRTSGRAEAPVFTDEGGRIITVARLHAPPG